MKNSHLFVAALLFFIGFFQIACKDDVQTSIPGTYYCAFKDSIYENTYVTGFDTLRIVKQTTSGSETYRVDRFLRFTRTVDGETQPEEAQHETWTGSYEASDKTLYIKNTGKSIAFDTNKKLANIDSKVYVKLE